MTSFTLHTMFQRFVCNRLGISEKAKAMRPKGSAKETTFEKHYPYLQHTTPRKNMTEKQRTKLIRKIERTANWLDNAVPGSPIPLGLDSLLSFIPFIGGFVGAIFAMYQVYLCTLFGIPLWLLLRMMAMLIIDALISSIPMVGGFIDMFFKANLWNYEALLDWLEREPLKDQQQAPSSSAAAASSTAPYGTEISWSQLGSDMLHCVAPYTHYFFGKKQT